MEGLGDARFEALYRRLERPVYNVVYRWVWNAESARDLVQEAFLRLWDHRHGVRVETAEPLVYRIAINLARSKLRRKQILRFVTLEGLRSEAVPDPQDTAADLESAESDARVRKAVSSLPEDLRQVVVLTAFTGLRYDQIGAVLGIPEGTVGSRRNRALKLLRESLSKGNSVERAG